MGVFSTGGVGIDLGSANVTICLENEGIVLREPSYALTLREDTDQLLAVGRDARQMLGRTPKDVALLSPIERGAVGNIELATALITRLSEKALGKRRALEKNRLVVSMSQGCTRVERAALEEAVRTAGAKRSALVRSSVAAAVISTVAGLPLAASRPRSETFCRISEGERTALPRSTFRSSAVRWPMIRPFSRRM